MDLLESGFTVFCTWSIFWSGQHNVCKLSEYLNVDILHGWELKDHRISDLHLGAGEFIPLGVLP